MLLSDIKFNVMYKAAASTRVLEYYTGVVYYF